MTSQRTDPKRILIQRNAAIGDVLLATAVLPALAQRFPGYAIDFETSVKDVLENNRYIERILFTGSAFPTDYEIVHDLNFVYEKQPHLSILAAYAKAVNINENEIQLSYDPSDQQKSVARSILIRNGLDGKNLVAVQSGASFWLKKMDPVYLEFLIDEIKKKYEVTFVLLGTAKDPLIKGAVDLRGACSIAESAAILQNCNAFIGNDSSLIHFAKAMDIPAAGFFGHSDPSLRIIPKRNDCFLVTKVSCRFCYHRQAAPVIIVICEKQPFVWRLLDIAIQTALRRWNTHRNRLTLIAALVLLFFHKWRERKGYIACCMRSLESQQTLEKIASWFLDLGLPKGK